MKLILVRHGHTDALKHGIIQGHSHVPLNRLGRSQARKVAIALRRKKIDVIYSSDSARARETAEAIGKFHPHLEIHFTSKLREKGQGIYEGRRSELYFKHEPKDFTRRQIWRPRKGESFMDLHSRIKGWWQEVRKQHRRETVLIVSHGGPLRFLITHIFHGPKFQVKLHYRHDNTGITNIEWRNGKPRLLSLNHTKHLGPAQRKR